MLFRIVFMCKREITTPQPRIAEEVEILNPPCSGQQKNTVRLCDTDSLLDVQKESYQKYEQTKGSE